MKERRPMAKRITALLLSASLLLSLFACAGTPEEKPTGEGIDPAELISNLREKYSQQEDKEYLAADYTVAKDEGFFVNLSFDLMTDTDFEYYNQIVGIYSDSDLTQEVSVSWELLTHETDSSIPQGHNRICLNPGPTPAGRIMSTYRDAEGGNQVSLSPDSTYLHEDQEGESWGALPQYYLALRVNPTTGEILEKPQVTIFTVESQLSAPQSEFYVTQDGLAALRWDEVEGADYYLVAYRDAESTGTFSVLTPMTKVTKTEWIHPRTDGDYIMNQLFYTGATTQDALLGAEQAGVEDTFTYEGHNREYTVIAANADTHSPIGTLHKGTEIAKQLPYELAISQNQSDAQSAGGSGNTKFIPSIGLLPMQKAITTAAGVTDYRRVLYDFDAAELREESYITYDEGENGEILNPQQVSTTNLHIPYTLEKTVFQGKMVVENVDPANYKEALDAVRQQQEDAAPRGGHNAPNLKQRPAPKTDDTAPAQASDLENAAIPADVIFASSALSEYFAIHMLAGSTVIDLADFPESADMSYLSDAWMEAIYQNPLILGANNAYLVPGTTLLMIEYDDNQETILQKQDEIRSKVQSVVAEIITEDMSDLEKELAINQYLCDSAEYNYAALEDAAANDFLSVDPAYNDSFTAYGILVDGVGVCASYAAAFQLLAEEAGLNAIVVTGYLGGVPHAWNRVNLDGQWHTVDVTNNDNPYLFNALLNLPDNAAKLAVVEDERFVMDSKLSDYESNVDTDEYYRVTGQYFDQDAIAAQLVAQLEEDGVATLRTGCDLNDAQFEYIAGAVADQLGNSELYGLHWMGVITLSTELF